MSDIYLSVLKKYWGYDSFRGIQEQIVHSIGEGKDTLGLMPTGGGKSITFQVPALAKAGICLVITPLIALMKDQVNNLREKGIKATAIYSGMTRSEIVITLENCIFGDYKFLYVSPERIATELFQTKLRAMKVSMIAVDEAHCISQWGYDFRPSYLKISEIRKLLPGIPVLALTATATKEVVDDIQDKLMFKEKNVFRMSFYRENLSYIVRNTDDKIGEAISILSKTEGSAIIYVRSRQKTKEICEILKQNGFTAEFYHAGIINDIKDETQKRWMEDKSRVMVATNAFGMGIDKPDVRIVIHIDIPDSIEAYFQEAGRAGRDGKKSYSVMLFNANDKRLLGRRVSENFPDRDYIKQVYEHLSYYYQIGMGSGRGCMFEFDLFEFCRRFQHKAVLVDSSLKILTNAGYIEYTEEQEMNSRLHILVSRDELELATKDDKESAGVMEVIMRGYTGLFSDYSFIEESLIAYRCNLRQNRVYEILKNLSQRRLISYIPRKKTPYIIYTKDRTELEYIWLTDDIYKDKKERYEKRVNAMKEYCINDSSCRSEILLGYFGEKSTQHCNSCDVCLKNKFQRTKISELQSTINTIKDFIEKNGKVTLQQLKSATYPNDSKTNEAIQFMCDMEMIKYENGYIVLCGKDN